MAYVQTQTHVPNQIPETRIWDILNLYLDKMHADYGGKPFEFRYKYASFEAYLDTIIDDRTHYRRYVDVLVFVHRFRVLRSLLEHIIRNSHYSVINTGAEYEANTISAEIEKIVRAVEALYGDD